MKTQAGWLVCLLAVAALAGCSTVQSRISAHHAEFEAWPPEVQQKISSGQIEVGFTAEQVRVAMGDPDAVFSRRAVNGSFDVWTYADHGPRFGIGIGAGSFHGGTAYGGGIGVSNIGRAGERLRVTFDQNGRVTTIEHFGRR